MVRPRPKWSLSAGYAHYTNWIDQLIRLGDDYDDGVTGGFNLVEPDPVPTLWRYGARSQVVDVGSAYAWNEYLTLTGGVEWVRGRNSFVSPSPATALDPDGNPVVPDWSTLPANSAVIVETTRITGGVDYWLTDAISCYFRYNYFDYEDKTKGLNSGTAHMFLGGMIAIF